jgi:hypothetical protein
MCKNTGILPLVIIFKERRFYQMPHSEHLAKSSLGKPDAPGAKTPQNCPWWGCFRPHHVQKHWESAPGHIIQRTYILPNTSFRISYKIIIGSARSTRGKNPTKPPLVAHWLPKVRENEVRLKAQYQI